MTTMRSGRRTPAPSHAVVWENDGSPLPDGSYGDRIRDALTALGFTVTVLDNTADAPGFPAAALHVISGGGTSVNDVLSPWMPRALERAGALLAGAVAGQFRLLGICLGAQMIAHSIAPGCVRNAGSFEVGVVEVSFATGSVVHVPEFHYQNIAPELLLRSGASVVAGNEHTAVQAFTFGPNVAGVQFHPEFTADDMRSLLSHHAGMIAALGGDPAAALGGDPAAALAGVESAVHDPALFPSMLAVLGH